MSSIPIISTAYINSLAARIDSAPDCTTLLKIQTEILGNLNLVLAEANGVISFLGTASNVPTDLSGALQWIESYIANHTLPSYQKALLLQSEIVAAIATLTTAINNKISELGCV